MQICSFYVSFKFLGIVYMVSMISNETIQEFQKLMERDYGLVLSVDEAREMVTDLVGYYDVLAQINHQEKMQTREVISESSTKN